MQSRNEAADRLAQPLRRRLKNGGIIRTDQGGDKSVGLLVNGDLALGEDGLRLEAEARCSIAVTDSWRIEPPRARCFSHWSLVLQRMTNNAEWHFNSDGSLCYVLGDEWADTLTSPEQVCVEEIAEVAAFFLIRNLRYLLTRQLIAYRNGFALWPAEWEQWSHGSLGRQAYRTQKKNGAR